MISLQEVILGRNYVLAQSMAVKLLPVPYKEFLDIEMQIYKEAQFARSWYYSGKKMYELDPNDFKSPLRAPIEFMVKYKKHHRLDAHEHNWLKCPITGYVHPYDAIYFGD